MIDAILKLSLRYRIFVVLGMLVFAAFSLWMLPSLTIDAFPDTTPVQVQINTYATGLAAEEVERQVTFPIEQEINGMPKLNQLRSLSKFGLSQVTVTFDDGTNIYFARQQVTERISNAVLPAGVVKPTLGPVATGLGEILHFMVQPASPETSLTDVRTFFDWVVKPSLRKVPGVAEINAWGGEKKQYQIRIDPDRLITYDISFEQVVDAIKSTNMNAGGSNIARGTETLIIQGIARTKTLDEIRNIVVGIKKDIPIQVSDVAMVMVGNDSRLGAISYMGKGESVMGLGFMLIGESSNTITHRLKDKYETIKASLPKDIKMDIAYDRTELVDKVIGTVRGNLFEGGLLVIAVLFIFLGNLRAGIVVATAIPFSMFFAFNGMMAFGIAGSLLSLGAIDFGMVVDSSVVLVEHLMRRMGEEGAEKRNRLELIYEAAMEVRMPTLFGELIIIIVYLPILTLEGVEGKLFRPMALTVVFALVGSLILSLTLIPALASLLLPKKMSHSEPIVVRLAAWIYKPILKLVLRFRIAAIMMVVGVSLVAVMMARSLGSEFIPKLSEGAIVINIFRPVGTSIQEAVRYNTKLEKMVLAAFPDEVKRVWSRLGSPEVATDPMGPEETDFFITLNPREKWTKAKTQEELIVLVDGLIKPLIGQEYSFTQPIEQRVNEMISGVRADVAVKIFGDDFEVLKKKAEQVEQILKTIQGAEDILVEPVSGQPVLQIKLKQEQLAIHGLAAKNVLQHIETLGSQPLGEILEGEQRFPLVAKVPDNLRSRPEAVGALIVTSASGEKIPLAGIADIQEIRGPSRISREWGQRRITIQCNVRNRDVGSFVTEAQKQIKTKVSFPTSRYRVEWGGQFEQLAAAKSRLAIIVPISLLMIIFLLYLTYRNMTDTLIVFTSVPLACIGGVAALWFRQMPFSISAAVGFIALFGLGVLNGMLLVTFIRQLRAEGMALLQAIENAGVTRLRAVLMTALVAGFGFIPMAFSDGVGAEVQKPLASVVIGGVISSSALTLFILPVIYSFFAPKKVPPLETK